MRPLISEFSYGYAVTDELIHGLHTPITAAAVFPSLYREGQAGGGYDVMIQGPAVPLFLQFKLSDCLTTQNASEAKGGQLATPYYRMHLRSKRHSNQHALLLDLESRGNEVYYCAPGFHRDHELNEAYLTQNVCDRSIWIWPSTIGPLPDDESHYAAFQNARVDHFYYCSQPRRVAADISFKAFTKRIFQRLQGINDRVSKTSQFETLADELTLIASKSGLLSRTTFNESRIADLRPIERASVIANVVFGSQLYIARLNEKS